MRHIQTKKVNLPLRMFDLNLLIRVQLLLSIYNQNHFISFFLYISTLMTLYKAFKSFLVFVKVCLIWVNAYLEFFYVAFGLNL